MAETQEDRKARIMERAYALRDAREKERQQIVEKAYDLQWRESCDDARTLDSKTLDMYMNQERGKQVALKKLRNEELSANENAWLQEWNKQIENMTAKEREKEDFRNMKKMEMVDGLKSQMEYNLNRKRSEFRNTRKEDQEEIAEVCSFSMLFPISLCEIMRYCTSMCPLLNFTPFNFN